MLQGIEIGCVPVPLHLVHVVSDLVSGLFCVGVQPVLPVKSIDLLLRNDIAGGRMMLILEVLSSLNFSLSDDLASEFPEDFPAFVVMCAQCRRLSDVSDLMESVLCPVFTTDSVYCSNHPLVSTLSETERRLAHGRRTCGQRLAVSRERLINCQMSDPTLIKSFTSISFPIRASKDAVRYFLEEWLLMRKWTSRTGTVVQMLSNTDSYGIPLACVDPRP